MDQQEKGSAHPPTSTDRTSVWLPLLECLTDTVPEWLVLKHPDSAFTGTGDVDSAAPRARWPEITGAFRRWAAEQQLGTVIVCPHAPTWLHLVALDPTGGRFYELDVNDRKLFLGSTLYRPKDLAKLTTIDPRSFRRLRPGAEGMIKLVHNGTRRGGRRNAFGLRDKGVLELLHADPAGVELAADLFGSARRAALRGARAAMEEGWDRPAMLMVELRSILRAPLEPDGIAKRGWFRIARQRCPVLHAVFVGKRFPPPDAQAWLRAVARTHDVFERSSPLVPVNRPAE